MAITRNTPERRVIATLMACSLVPGAALAQHQGDLWVARTAADRLTLSPSGYVPQANFTTLPPGGFFFPGWADSSPGFDHLGADEPENDAYMLYASGLVYLELVDADPAFRVVRLGSPVTFLESPGDAWQLGDGSMHVHDTFHINQDDAAFDPNQCIWQATFLLRGGSPGNPYFAGEPFTFHFTNVVWGPGLDPPVLADGDFDADGDVDGDDLVAMFVCLNGPGALSAPDDPTVTTCAVDCANSFDFDVDLDVDLCDFAAFQLLTGS